jgi:cation transport regulator
MPYTKDNPPERIKDMPAHCQEIWIAAYNSALEQYKDEGKASAVAYTAVKSKYKQNEKGEWVAKESKDMNVIAEIIQEAGRRGKITDPKVQKLALLTEPTEADLVEADSVLLWLKEQALIKQEDGEVYPASAYAHTPDPDNASTWKLRLWESAQQKVTKVQLGRAAAALSPGGLRGQRVEIVKEALPSVKRRIRAEYAKLDVPDEDVPRWVKEIESRQLISEFIPLVEAKVDGGGKAQLVVIKPGFNATKERYYPLEVLARDCKIFEGVKMYADHPTSEEDKTRPERSIKDWVATLHNVHPNAQGVIMGEADILEPWLKERLATLRDKGLLKDIGVSINAVGTASKAEVEGVKTNLIERLVRARSVDFVTEAGAGGQVELYEANSDATLDVDIVTLETLRERRPDLVKAVETGIRAEITKEVKTKLEVEEKLKESNATIETLTAERDVLKGKVEQAEKDKLVAATQAKVTEALGKAELPDAAKTRIAQRFANAASDEGLAEAIKAEVDYIAAIRESGKVKGFGDTVADPKKAHEALIESFIALGLSKEQAEIAAKGR